MTDEKDSVDAAAAVKAIAKDAANALLTTASDAANDVRATAEKVANVVKELASLTAQLTEQQGAQIQKIRRNAFYAACLLGLCVLLIGVMGYAVHRIDENSQRIVEVQTRTNSNVLCGLFTVFLNSYNENSVAAQEDLPRYRDAFNKIEDGANVLGCTQTERRQR